MLCAGDKSSASNLYANQIVRSSGFLGSKRGAGEYRPKCKVEESAPLEGERAVLTGELLHQFHLNHRLLSAVDDVHEYRDIWPVEPVPYRHEHEVIETYQQIYY